MADHISVNGGIAEQTAGWQLSTPFLTDAPRNGGPSAPQASPARTVQQRSDFSSPFIAEYDLDGGQPSAETALFASLVGELYDEEFDVAVEDLIDEAAAIADSAPAYEVSDPPRQRAQKARMVRAYLEPLESAAETTLDRLNSSLSGADASAANELDVERLLEQYGPPPGTISPTFDNFLGGLVRKGIGALKKAAATVGKIMPTSLILGRLKALVRPLLDRVLRIALDRLPAPLRPVASQLAKKLLGVGELSTDAGDEVELSAADPSAVQEELDTQLAGYLAFGEEFERMTAIDDGLASSTAAPDTIGELERSRDGFVRRLSQLQAGDDPGPAIEQFVPAVLGALKLGVKLLGRPRVVNAIAGFMSPLIAKYVGREQSKALSRALVDVGLKLASLEAPGAAEPLSAEYAIASTIEDTVSHLVQNAPEGAWDSDALLETYTLEAFQQAATAHFPDEMIRSELHEANAQSGAWIAVPTDSAAKRYEKYSRVIEASITPQSAATLKTFGGVTLRDFLRDRVGVAVDAPVRTRVHLYRAIPGTRLSLIALHEKQVPGLASAGRASWSLFHPLTTEAAGLLLNEPGLGKDVPAEVLARRGPVAVGQRLYYLEIPGVRVRLAPRSPNGLPRPAGSSHPHVTLDFGRRELSIALVYSETHAQELAKQLRQRLPAAAILMSLKARHAALFARVLSGASGRALRIVHAGPPMRRSSSALRPLLAAIGSQVTSALVKSVLTALGKELQSNFDRFAGAVEQAASHETDGITLRLVFKAPAVLEPLQRVLGAKGPAAIPALLAALDRQTPFDYTLDVRPGVARG